MSDYKCHYESFGFISFKYTVLITIITLSKNNHVMASNMEYVHDTLMSAEMLISGGVRVIDGHCWGPSLMLIQERANSPWEHSFWIVHLDKKQQTESLQVISCYNIFLKIKVLGGSLHFIWHDECVTACQKKWRHQHPGFNDHLYMSLLACTENFAAEKLL